MGNSDDLPIFRPKLGRADRASGRAGGSFRNAALAGARLRARAGRLLGGGRALRVAAQAPGALSRRVVIKAHVVKMNAYGAKAAKLHLRYIERDGVEKDGSKGLLYGPEGPAEGIEQPRPGEKHQFRLIVSPEDAGELDLTKYVRNLMAQVEKDVGRRLEWAAVNHFDTDHPHAHVVVRGVDREGQAFRFDRAYISHGLRRRAQELASRELGPRTEREMKRAQDREITRERLTSLDAELDRRATDRIVVVPGPGARRGGSGIDDRVLLARLEHLENLRLVERVAPSRWVLAEGWTSQLRELGSRGDVLKQIHVALRGDPARYRIVRAGEAIEPAPGGSDRPLVGRVAAKGLSDELRGAFYAVLETPAGMGYHVPLDRGSAEALRVGDIVSFSTKPSLPAGDATTRHRLVVRKDELCLDEQVHYAGPVPIDRLSCASLAPYGFGADLRRALDRRKVALRRMGIDPTDDVGGVKLRELERRALEQRVADRLGLSVVTDPRSALRGRLDISERGADGTPYAVVNDGVRVRVVPATPEMWRRNGKTAVASMDKSGTWRVRSPDQDRDR